MTLDPWLALAVIPVSVVIAGLSLMALPDPAPPIELPPEAALGADDPDPLTRRLRSDVSRHEPGWMRGAG